MNETIEQMETTGTQPQHLFNLSEALRISVLIEQFANDLHLNKQSLIDFINSEHNNIKIVEPVEHEQEQKIYRKVDLSALKNEEIATNKKHVERFTAYHYNRRSLASIATQTNLSAFRVNAILILIGLKKKPTLKEQIIKQSTFKADLNSLSVNELLELSETDKSIVGLSIVNLIKSYNISRNKAQRFNKQLKDYTATKK